MQNSGTMFDGLAKFADVFFNGRPAESAATVATVTIQDLVKRGKSTVRVGKKYYSIEVTEVKLTATPKK